MWAVWRITRQTPYCIYHGLSEDFVPVGGGDRFPPPLPSRHQALLYAFGSYEVKHQARLAGAKVEGDRRRRPKKAREGQGT